MNRFSKTIDFAAPCAHRRRGTLVAAPVFRRLFPPSLPSPNAAGRLGETAGSPPPAACLRSPPSRVGLGLRVEWTGGFGECRRAECSRPPSIRVLVLSQQFVAHSAIGPHRV